MYIDRKGNYHKKPKNVLPKKRESAYGIFIKNSKVLLVKPTWINLWEFPGGEKEEDENLFETLKMEFLEETGFEIIEIEKNPINTINMKFYADDLNEYFDSKMHFFIVRKISKKNKEMIDNNEIKNVKYIPILDLNKKNMNNIYIKF